MLLQTAAWKGTEIEQLTASSLAFEEDGVILLGILGHYSMPFVKSVDDHFLYFYIKYLYYSRLKRTVNLKCE